MIKYSIKRILSLIPVIFAISIVLFSLTKIMPGDPVSMMIPTSAKPEQIPQLREEITKQLGLDKSLPEQYVAWIGNVAQGELGFSSWKNDDVKNVIANPLKNTVILNFFVLIFSLTISITAGIRSAVKKNSFVDQFWQVFSLICMSVPTFFIGLCLVFVFALRLGWLPSNGMPVDGSGLGEWVRFLVLPVITLTITSLASTVRYVRNAMLDALSQDYIRTARSKGLSEKVVVYSHAFRNALIPIVTVVIAQIGTLFGGSMITESVFVWDGMGSTLLTALNRRDFYLVIAMNMFYAVVYLKIHIISDFSYSQVLPRIIHV